MREFERAYNALRGYVEKEWDRIQSMERDQAAQELDTPSSKNSGQGQRPTLPSQVAMDASRARRILGVSETAKLEEIRAAYDRLVERSNPKNFPEGSEAQRAATDIQRRIHQAYDILIEQLSITERRFGTLEID